MNGMSKPQAARNLVQGAMGTGADAINFYFGSIFNNLFDCSDYKLPNAVIKHNLTMQM